MIEHRLHRLICPCCSTSTCASLPADVDVSRYGPRLSALVGLLGSAFPLSFRKSQALLQQVLGVERPRASIVRSLQRVSAALEQPTTAAQACAWCTSTAPVVRLWSRGSHHWRCDGCVTVAFHWCAGRRWGQICVAAWSGAKSRPPLGLASFG